MANQPKILAFSGSLRRDSTNNQVLQVAEAAAIEAGAIVTHIDLKEYPLPIFDQDIEEEGGLPENAKKLKRLFREHNALMIASPEYNSSYPAVLKNVIDWISRPETSDEPALDCFKGKIAVIMSASPGPLGGLRGLIQLRALLENIMVTVIPQQKALPSAYNALDELGNLKEESQRVAFQNLGKTLTDVTRKLMV